MLLAYAQENFNPYVFDDAMIDAMLGVLQGGANVSPLALVEAPATPPKRSAPDGRLWRFIALVLGTLLTADLLARVMG